MSMLKIVVQQKRTQNNPCALRRFKFYYLYLYKNVIFCCNLILITTDLTTFICQFLNVDDNGNDVQKGTVGELLAKGDNVMIGYYKEPNRTAKVLKSSWLHTKDLAYIDKESGMLYIKGRKDGMIIRGGMNIYPQEIENALMQDSRVQDVLAYGTKDTDVTRIGIKIKGNFNNTKEVKEMCIKLLPTYQVPNLIEIVDNIPKNGSGKKIRI